MTDNQAFRLWAAPLAVLLLQGCRNDKIEACTELAVQTCGEGEVSEVGASETHNEALEMQAGWSGGHAQYSDVDEVWCVYQCREDAASSGDGNTGNADGTDSDSESDGSLVDDDSGLTEDSGGSLADGDSDGFAAPEDCDDADANVHPDATEVCDEADNDCDGTVDESDAADVVTWYLDSDGDGYGTTTTTVQACSPPSMYVADGTDCDDGASNVNPGESEVADGIDNDCDEVRDEHLLVPGALVLSEIHYHGEHEPDGEWFEVFNASGSVAYLDGFLVDFGGAGFYVAPDAVSVASGDRFVFCFSDLYVGSDCDYVYGSDVNSTSALGSTFNSSLRLADSGTLSLAASGVSVDSTTYYNGSGGWPSVNLSYYGWSIELDATRHTSSDNDSGYNWCSTTSSPGYAYYMRNYGTTSQLADFGTPGAGPSCSR